MATRTIGTEIVLQGEKQFNDAMKSVNNNLKNLKTDMALVSEEFAENADSMEALTKKEDVLRQSVDQHRAKVDALQKMYKKQVDTYGEDSAAADKYRQQLNQATAALIREERSLKKTSEALDSQRAAAAEAAEATEDLGDASKKAEPKIKEAAEAVEDMSKKADKAESKLPAVARGLGTIAAAAIKAGAAATAAGAGLGTAAVVAIAGFAKESAEAAKAAQEAGETLSEEQAVWLAYADTLGGLDISAQRAKAALGGMLLPTLEKLASSGTRYLNNFSISMKMAGSDTSKQADVIRRYAKLGVQMLLESLPEYVDLGKELLGGVLDGLGESSGDVIDAGADLVFDFLESILDAAPEVGEGAEQVLEILLSKLSSRGPDIVVSAAEVLGTFTTGLIQNAEKIIPVAGTLILTLAEALIAAIPGVAETLAEVIVDIGQYLSNPENLSNIARSGIDLGKALVEGIWDGVVRFWSVISEGLPGLVSGLQIGIDFALTGSTIGGIPGYASGLPYVPYDNYLARLHRGEAVLTADEASAYRRSKNGGGTTKQFNLTIHTQSLSKEELDMIVAYVNGKLGDDL